MICAFDKTHVSAPFLQSTSLTIHENSRGVVNRIATLSGFEADGEVSFAGNIGCARYSTGTVTSAARLVVADTQVTALLQGNVSNALEICELYGIDAQNCLDDVGKADGAKLLLALYMEGFSDTYGDFSDQPACLLGSLTGDFAFVLFDGVSQYLLVARSASGKVPVFWGLDDADATLVISTTPCGLSELPPGCAYESQPKQDEEGESFSRLMNFTFHSPSRRRVDALPQTDSHGHLCGLKFKSVSGTDFSAILGNGPEGTC